MSKTDENEERPMEFLRSTQFDALYYGAARASLERARASVTRIQAVEKELTSLLEREQQAKKEEDERTLESLAIQLVDGLDYEMCDAYSPYVEGIALTHILACACLEAHINLRAKAVLSGQRLEHFDRLALKGKWLLLPSLVGKPGLDPSREPFQSFDELVGYRDKLVHAKPKVEPWEIARPPAFLLSLGLAIDLGEKSLATASAMLRELSRQLGEDEPEWLSFASPHALGFEIRRHKPGRSS